MLPAHYPHSHCECCHRAPAASAGDADMYPAIPGRSAMVEGGQELAEAGHGLPAVPQGGSACCIDHVVSVCIGL